MAKGARPGERRGGPAKGTPNKRTEARVEQMTQAAAMIAEVIPDAFEGDSHALLMAVYKDPRHPVELRLDAAKAAIGYEKPRLQSIDGNMNLNHQTHEDRLEELWRRAKGIDPTIPQ